MWVVAFDMNELFIRSFGIPYFIVGSRLDLVKVGYTHTPCSIPSRRSIGDKHWIDQWSWCCEKVWGNDSVEGNCCHFYSPQGPRMGFWNGSQICLGINTDEWIVQIWVSVCIISDQRCPFLWWFCGATTQLKSLFQSKSNLDGVCAPGPFHQ